MDFFVKHRLKAKYHIRYVDDFIILHESKKQLENWKKEIEEFLEEELKLELHLEKSKIIHLSRGVDFVGFRIFYYFKLLRKRNVKKIVEQIKLFNERKINYSKFLEIFRGWQAYAKWANSYKIREKLMKNIINKFNLSNSHNIHSFSKNYARHNAYSNIPPNPSRQNICINPSNPPK